MRIVNVSRLLDNVIGTPPSSISRTSPAYMLSASKPLPFTKLESKNSSIKNDIRLYTSLQGAMRVPLRDLKATTVINQLNGNNKVNAIVKPVEKKVMTRSSKHIIDNQRPKPLTAVQTANSRAFVTDSSLKSTFNGLQKATPFRKETVPSTPNSKLEVEECSNISDISYGEKQHVRLIKGKHIKNFVSQSQTSKKGFRDNHHNQQMFMTLKPRKFEKQAVKDFNGHIPHNIKRNSN